MFPSTTRKEKSNREQNWCSLYGTHSHGAGGPLSPGDHLAEPFFRPYSSSCGKERCPYAQFGAPLKTTVTCSRGVGGGERRREEELGQEEEGK